MSKKPSIYDDPRYERFRPKPWPLWKQAARHLWEAFDWGDHEYLRFTLFGYPFTVWGTVYEQNYRRSWHRRIFPWRIRFAWAGLLRQWCCSACTLCQQKITLRELLSKDPILERHMSGSMCHRTCSRLYGEALDAVKGVKP